MKQQFEFTLDFSETFFVDEIWPDGDAPENPTVDDVRKAIKRTRLYEWNMEPEIEDLRIRDVTAQAERLEKLSQALKNKVND